MDEVLGRWRGDLILYPFQKFEKVSHAIQAIFNRRSGAELDQLL
jgi:hypothetical protein